MIIYFYTLLSLLSLICNKYDAFYEQSRMLMRQDINNDVSMNPLGTPRLILSTVILHTKMFNERFIMQHFLFTKVWLAKFFSLFFAVGGMRRVQISCVITHRPRSRGTKSDDRYQPISIPRPTWYPSSDILEPCKTNEKSGLFQVSRFNKITVLKNTRKTIDVHLFQLNLCRDYLAL